MSKTPKKTRAVRFRGGNLTAATTHCDTVRQRIVRLRKDRGLTSAEVSKQMGISRPFYTQLEGGTRRLSLVYFLMICRVLRVEPGDLLK